MVISAKAFASITVLLFLLFFLFITTDIKKEELTDFIIISQIETKKESTYLNFQQILDNSINDCKDDPLIVKEHVISESYKFIIKEDNFFITNIITNKEKKIDYLEYAKLIKVIVYKPAKNVIVKEIFITNGILNNKQLLFKTISKRYNSIYFFPENYKVKKVVFC